MTPEEQFWIGYYRIKAKPILERQKFIPGVHYPYRRMVPEVQIKVKIDA